jgi:chromosome segregation ATPase
MSALKENKIEEQDKSSEQLEFALHELPQVISSDIVSERKETIAEVIELPKIEPPQLAIEKSDQQGHLSEIDVLEEKKNSLLAELERLNQYSQQKQKKLQEAKSFIEQYERVVVHKKRYIEEVEVERAGIEKEIAQLKSTRDKKLYEIQDLKEEWVSVKKLLLEEKNNIGVWEVKIHEKKVELAQLESTYRSLQEKKDNLFEEFKALEENFLSSKIIAAERKSEILLAEEQLQQINQLLHEKKKEVDNFSEVLQNYLSGHKQVEVELVKSIDRLKSEECTWRLLVEERTKNLDKLEIQIGSITDEFKLQTIELEQLKSQVLVEKNRLLSVGDHLQKEMIEAQTWETKVYQLQEKVNELRYSIQQMEMDYTKEVAEIEMLRSRRLLEEQENFKLLCQKEQLLEAVGSLEQKKVYLQQDIEKQREEALQALKQEISLKTQEEKSLRLMREAEFKEECKNEKKQMKEIFWNEVDVRVNALSEEVTNYLASCLQVNFQDQQKVKLNAHIFHLVKYYHGLDVSKFTRLADIVSFLRRYQPVLTVVLVVLCSVVLSLQILN